MIGSRNSAGLFFLSMIVIIASILPIPAASGEQSGTFKESWIASGQRQSLDFAIDREVGTFRLTGHVNLKDEVGEEEDYWAECVGLSDSVSGSAAR